MITKSWRERRASCVIDCSGVVEACLFPMACDGAVVLCVWCLILVSQVRLHSLEHAGMFISGPDGSDMTRLVEVSQRCSLLQYVLSTLLCHVTSRHVCLHSFRPEA